MASMNTTPHILIVDDERAIAELVCTLLEQEGMQPTSCLSGEEALEAFQKTAFDLAIIDIMMPGMDGFALCQELRRQSTIPIIFLSAKDEETDKVIGFMLGADDYVSKPFKARELIARVKARLRRAALDNSPQESAPSSVLTNRGIALDTKSHEVTLHDVPLHLTPKEFAILELLLKAQGKPVSTKELFETVWESPYAASDANTVMVHIRHLRAKLAEIDQSKTFIETAWGVGYKVESLPTAASEGGTSTSTGTVNADAANASAASTGTANAGPANAPRP